MSGRGRPVSLRPHPGPDALLTVDLSTRPSMPFTPECRGSRKVFPPCVFQRRSSWPNRRWGRSPSTHTPRLFWDGVKTDALDIYSFHLVRCSPQSLCPGRFIKAGWETYKLFMRRFHQNPPPKTAFPYNWKVFVMTLACQRRAAGSTCPSRS